MWEVTEIAITTQGVNLKRCWDWIDHGGHIEG